MKGEPMYKTTLKAILIILLIVGFAYAGSQQTTSTPASTIITNARYYLNEPSAVFWSDTELLVWLNQGTIDIVGRNKALESSESVSLIANTVEYSLTDAYLAITDVVYLSPDSGVWVSKGLIRSNPSSVGHESAVGEPVYWYEKGELLGVFPVLSSLDGSSPETVTAYYITRPTAVTSGQNVLIPAHYEHALTLYITARAWYKDGQFAKGARMMAEYYEELDRFRIDFNEQIKIPRESVK